MNYAKEVFMKGFFCIIITFALTLCNLNTAFADTIAATDCISYILIDAKSGQVLTEKNPNKKALPASTTKIMTAVLALENGDLDRKLIASYEAVNDIGKDGMNIGIVAGEELRLEDLLNALLVRSANETANIICENLAPSKEDFVKLMNKRALELGALNTHFVNPCGKDSDTEDIGQLSTAYDLARIAKYALTFQKFREIVSKKLCKIPPNNKKDADQYLANTNKLLQNAYKSDYYSNVTGIKTGYTDKAGNNLISSAVNSSGTELIAVVMGYRGSNIFQFSKELLEYGFKNFVPNKLIEKGTFYQTIVSPEDSSKSIQLVAGSDMSALFPKSTLESWTVDKKEFLNPTIKAPIKLGEQLGYIEYTVNNSLVGIVPIVSNTEIQKKNISIKRVQESAKRVQDSVSGNEPTVLLLILLFLLILLLILKPLKRFVKNKHTFGHKKILSVVVKFSPFKIKLNKKKKKIHIKKNSIKTPSNLLKKFKYYKHYNDT